MLLGPAGVGKSSLKRGLMSLPFDARMNSTIVADVQSLKPDIPEQRSPFRFQSETRARIWDSGSL